MHKILITFPVDVEFTSAQLQQLDQAVGNICSTYEQQNPGRIMWPFGHGALMTKNPFFLVENEPMEYDEDCYHIEVAEREADNEELKKLRTMDGHIGVSRQDPFHDIIDFHRKFGLTYKGPARALPEELDGFRTKFMAEELAEYVSTNEMDHNFFTRAIAAFQSANAKFGRGTPDLEKKLDALVDLVYVAIGTAYLHGFNFNEAWRRVHEANMKKVRAERAEQSARGSTFDVVKPEGWTAPDLSDLVCPFGGKQTGTDLNGKPLPGDQL